MKIIELDIIEIFEGISRDDLIANIEKKRKQEFKDLILKKMHELVQRHGSRQSIGGYAFEISRYLGGAISPKELEQMYRKEYMNEGQVNEWGRIVKGVNTTVDINTDEIKTQAAKFGNIVDKDGFPPRMTTTAKSKSTTVKHHTPIKEAPRYTAAEWAIISGGHTLEETFVEPKKPGKLFTALTEGYKLQLERDKNLLVLNIVDNATGKRTEVRGKPGYETNGYDADDPLHKLLDVVGKSANISELMNGEVVTINPKHPDAARALSATDRAYNEAFDTDVEWIKEPGSSGSTVYAAMVDEAYVELTYKPSQKGVYISFTRGGRMSVTGEGSQNKVFGAVINHIKQWTTKNKPAQIVFSAYKPRTGAFGSQDNRRSSLYRKMVQRFANQNGYDYDVEDTGNEDTFILKRKETNTQTTEALDQPYPIRWNMKADEEWFAWAKDDKMQIQIKTIADGRWTIRFKVREKMDKTGEGDEFRIFATVKAAIQEWWTWASKNAEVNVITFSADKIVDNSRSRLYNRFAKQFASTIGYDMEVVTGRATDIFYLKKPGLKETRSFQPQTTPLQALVIEYLTFTSTGIMTIVSDGAKSPQAAEELKKVFQTLNQSNKNLQTVVNDKQKLEANKTAILKNIHDMMIYAVAHLKANMIPQEFDSKKKQINSVLIKYNNITKNESINETEGLGLTIFDIDETLMRTTAQIKVVKDGNPVRSLTNQEFNNYELKPGEEFDFGEFRNAEKFKRESEPIAPMIAKLKAILRNAGDSKVIMLTARADFDDKETFLNTFRDLGIDMSRVHVHRAGNTPGNPAQTKAVWIRKYLDTGKYARVRLYDDSMGNIKMFNALAKEYSNIKFYPYLVTHDGNIKTVRENFADGKNPGRKGLAKRSGVNTKASVSSLRKTAKNSSGEKQRMAHWLANMKAGKAKKK